MKTLENLRCSSGSSRKSSCSRRRGNCSTRWSTTRCSCGIVTLSADDTLDFGEIAITRLLSPPAIGPLGPEQAGRRSSPLWRFATTGEVPAGLILRPPFENGVGDLSTKRPGKAGSVGSLTVTGFSTGEIHVLLGGRAGTDYEVIPPISAVALMRSTSSRRRTPSLATPSGRCLSRW